MRPAVTGGQAGSFRAGMSSACSWNRQVRSTGLRWMVTSAISRSSSRTSSSSISSLMPSWASRRTARPKRRRRSSISTFASRSSASSSSRVRSALRVTRKTACSSTTMPTNIVCSWAAMICSTGTNRLPSGSGTRRGKTLGTFTRAKRRSPVSGSLTIAARLSAMLEMYGNGCAGSTARGVSTGNMRCSNCSIRWVRSAPPREAQSTSCTPWWASWQSSSSSTRSWSTTNSSAVVAISVSCSCGDIPS